MGKTGRAEQCAAANPSMKTAKETMDGDVYVHALRTREATKQPEYRLVEAILNDAVDTVQRYLQSRDGWAALKRGQRVSILSDLAWLFGDQPNWPYSFLSCCEYAGIDAGACRRAVVERLGLTWEGLKKRHAAEIDELIEWQRCHGDNA